MKQRRINATLIIAAVALTILLILTVLPLASTAAPRLERQSLESLRALNTAETTEHGVPLSAFSAPSAASAVQFPDIERALALIEQHHISYIYVGQLEQAVYDPDGLAKFDDMVRRGELEVAYENERVKIYRKTRRSSWELIGTHLSGDASLQERG